MSYESTYQFPRNWDWRSDKRNFDTVKSYGYDCVSATVITALFECIPTDENKMVIIVAKDNENHANSIAKTFHNAGVLSIGLLYNAELDCYDSVESEASYTEYMDLIKAVQSIATQGMIAYDFNDLQATLADTKHFFIRSVIRYGNERVVEAVGLIKCALTSSRLDTIERISIFLYFNRDGKQPLVIQEITALTDFVNELPECVYVIWSIYSDKTIKDNEIKVTIIATGKKLGNGSGN